MPGQAFYRAELGGLSSWEPYLLAHSNLPGPRGNLELAHAVADLGHEEQFLRWSSLSPQDAPENTPAVFLAFCGALGLGELLRRAAKGESAVQTSTEALLERLRALAADPRWRVREAVATALQRWGDGDMPALLSEMATWALGNRFEQRAAMAALCEPRLLAVSEHAATVLTVLDRITATLPAAADRKTDAFKVLRQALGYGWSVAVAALPEEGKRHIENWMASTDPDVRWVMRENLRKKRLSAVDPAWVDRWTAALS